MAEHDASGVPVTAYGELLFERPDRLRTEVT
jgi:hypothetical protein